MRVLGHANKICFLLTAAAILLLPPTNRLCQAGFMENMAICAKGISLANTVTAYPPDQMSVHYNPAGLTNVHDGVYLSQGFLTAEFSLRTQFDADPDYKGWLGGVSGKGYDFSMEADPVAGKSGSTLGIQMYVPLLGDQSMETVGMPTPFGFTLAMAPFPFALSYRKPGSRWTFGLAAYSPAMGGYYRDDDDPARFQGRAVALQHLVYAAPAFGYRLTDSLSVGMTVALGQTAGMLNTDMRLPNDMVALTKILGETTRGLNIPVISQLTFPAPWFGGGIGPYDTISNLDLRGRDDYSPSYNLGLLWEPVNWFAFGLNYQSKVKLDMQGPFRITYGEEFQRMVSWMGSSPILLALATLLDLPYRPTPFQAGSASVEGLDLPQRVQAGIMVRPIKRLRLMCDLHWINYSKTKEYRVVFDRDIQAFQVAKFLGHLDGNRALVVERNMKDEAHLSFGAELQVLDWLYLRGGYEDRKTSLNWQYFDVFAPFPDLEYYGAGLGINLKSGMKIDLAIGRLVSKTWRVPNNTSRNLNSTEFTEAVYNPYGGLDVSGDMEATIMAANFSMPFKYVYEIGNILKDSYYTIKKHTPFLIDPERSKFQLDE